MEESERIPADIRQAAIEVVKRGYDEGFIEEIARALLAERERCADIAKSHIRKYTIVSATNEVEWTAAAEAVSEVEAAIRG